MVNDLSWNRSVAPSFLDKDYFGLQTLQHVMRMTRTWDTTMSMIPKGGDTIWGNLDWSPENGYKCPLKKQKNNDTDTVGKSPNGCSESSGIGVNYGRIISFGKGVAEAPSSEIERIEFRVIFLPFFLVTFSLASKKFTWLIHYFTGTLTHSWFASKLVNISLYLWFISDCDFCPPYLIIDTKFLTKLGQVHGGVEEAWKLL